MHKNKYFLRFKNALFGRSILLLLSFCTFYAQSQTYKWGNVLIGGGGFVDGIVTSKKEQNLMYCRTDVGGAYKWNATTSTWTPLTDWVSENETGYLGVESIAIDPQTPSKFYMLVGTSYFNGGKTSILRSSDYGNTFALTDVSSQFKAHGNGMGRQNGEKLVVDPNNGTILLCGTRANGLFKSSNSGVSWSRLTGLNVTTTSNANGISFVLYDPTTGTTGNATQRIFVGVSQTGTNFYMSSDGGSSFTAVSGAPTSYMPQRATLASDGNLFIAYADKEGPYNPATGQLWKYNIANKAWTNVTPSGVTSGFGGISVDPNNAKRLIASTINVYSSQYKDASNATAYGDRFYLSTDGGSSWRDLVGSNSITMDPNGCTWISGQSIHWAGCIEFNPFNTKEAWVVSGNGVFSCSDVDATKTTWKFNAKGIEESVPLDIVSITGGPLVSVIGDFDGFKHTDITQFPPVHTPRMGTTTGLACAALSTNTLVRVGTKMYYTTNQGTSWTQTSAINGTKGRVALSANGTVILHCPDASGTTYRSTNNGGSWSTVNGLSVTGAVPVADMVNTNKFYAYNSSGGNMLVSTDAGANFSNAGSPGSGGSMNIRTVPGKEGHIWVALYNGGLTRSTNSGTSFTKISGVTTCSAVGLGKAATGASYHTIYIWGTVGGVLGIHRSTDEGATWTRINDDAHEYGGPGNGQFVIGDMNTYGRVYMSSVGRGIILGDLQTGTNASPTVSLTAPNNNSSVCSGTTITLTAAATDSDGSISKVEFYDGTTLLTTITTGTTYTYSWTNASVGIHTITAKAYDNASAVTTSSAITVTVNALPTASITAGGSTVFCDGGRVVLAASTGSSYVWKNGTTQVSTSSSYTATSTGSYTVEVTNSNTCKATSAATTVTVNPVPAVTITSPTGNSFSGPASVTFTANVVGTGISKVQFYNNNQLIVEDNSSPYTTTISNLNSGDYTLKAIAITQSNCSDTASMTIGVITGIHDQMMGTELSIYPNPFDHATKIELKGNFTYVLYNAIGVAMDHGNATDMATLGADLPKGIYMLKISHSGGSKLIRITKD